MTDPAGLALNSDLLWALRAMGHDLQASIDHATSACCTVVSVRCHEHAGGVKVDDAWLAGAAHPDELLEQAVRIVLVRSPCMSREVLADADRVIAHGDAGRTFGAELVGGINDGRVIGMSGLALRVWPPTTLELPDFALDPTKAQLDAMTPIGTLDGGGTVYAAASPLRVLHYQLGTLSPDTMRWRYHLRRA